jgi:cytochrome P450
MLAFNPRDPAFIANPYPFYHELRSAMPVWNGPDGRIFLTRYEDTANLLRDRRLGKFFHDPDLLRRRFGPTALREPAVIELSHMMLMCDPPDHTRLRGLVTKVFTARKMEEMRPFIQSLTDRLLDQVTDQGEMDVIRDLAFPLPMLVICELLGIPEEDRAGFVNGAASGGTLLNPVVPTREELDRANEGSRTSELYFENLFDLRRREPRDDLLTLLVQAEEAGDRLTTEELRANVSLLFGAGHETTVNLIGNGLLSLHGNPGQWHLLRDNPALVPNAIEEILRYESPVQVVSRVVAEPIRFGDVECPKGASILGLIGAANRDPAEFPDPDRMDVTRERLKPLSFGGGIHFCIGAQLARIEAEVVFSTVLRRLPDLVLPERHQPKWRDSFTLRGLTTLPATWSSARH